ncbi:MAG: hypothetical protein CMP59_07100 [Flavobacteriales bacterium]|nr:hypothetical protein [Flavobacteriales bacterium]
MKKKTTSSSPSKSIEKKLKSYATVAASLLAADASAQVIYTNINDTTLVNNGDFFDIDFNSDGINDATISLINSNYTTSFYSLSIYVNIKAASMVGSSSAEINTNFYSGTSSSVSVYEVAAFNNNQAINNSANTWYSYGYVGGDAYIRVGTYSTSSAQIGQFPGQGQKFAGVRFFIGNNLHYGWVRLDMAATYDSVTVFDFAYDTTANTPILAGDTGLAVGISEFNADQTDMYSTEGRLMFPNGLSESSDFRIYDLKGQLQERGRIAQGKESQQLRSKYNGIYIVELNNELGTFRKKLWLENN